MRITKGLFVLTVIISCALSLNAFCQDPNEPDDSISNAKPLIVGDTPITHTIGYYGDADWSVFFLVAGNNYSVRVENVYPSLDITLTIIRPDGTVISYVDDRDAGKNETYTTTPTSDGFLYVLTQSYDPSVYGTNMTYSIRVTMDSGEGHGWVYNSGETSLDLQWTPCTLPGLTGYNIYRSASFLNSYNLINATPIPLTTTTYHDTGLTPNTTYYYYVMAWIDSSDVEYTGIFAGFTKPTIPPDIVSTTINASTSGGKYQLQLSQTYTVTVTVSAGGLTYAIRLEGDNISTTLNLNPAYLDDTINPNSGNHTYTFSITPSVEGDYQVAFHLRDQGTNNVFDIDSGVAVNVSTSAVIHVKDYTCPSSENFIRHLSPDGTFFNAFDGAFYVSTHSSQGCSLGIAGSATDSVYGLWQCQGNEMSYTPDNVYRVKYTIHTDQSDQGKVPNIRMLAYCGSSTPTENPDFAIAGGNRLGCGAPFSPTVAPQTYNVYFGPPDLSGISEVQYFRFSFEVLDFSSTEEGTNFLDEVSVERFPTPAKSEGSLANTLSPPFTGWVSDSNGQNIFEPVTVSSDPTLGISLESPGAVASSGHVNYGHWRFDTSTNIFYTANVLYRCVYTISAPTSTATARVAKIRFINNNTGNDWSSEMDIDPYVYYAQMPTPAGSEYSVWFETLPQLYTGADVNNNMMTFIFDIMDGNDNQAGKVTLSKVELYTYPIP